MSFGLIFIIEIWPINLSNQGAYSKIINEDAIEMVFSEAKIDTKNRRYKVLKDTAIFLNR